MSGQRRHAAIGLVLLLVLTGCFETPVHERLEISFRDDAPMVVRAEVAFAEDPPEEAVRDRLRLVRQEYLDMRDAWTRRFERLDARYETYGWERSQGELVGVTRTAIASPERLSDLFYDTSIRADYVERDGVADLTLYAGSSQRATREQEREFRDSVDQFSRDVTAYFHAMDAVYDYLDREPDRAVVIFAALVGEDGDWESPDEDETALLEQVTDATDRVMSVLATSQSRAWSFEEISSLVNDPFPAEVVVLPGGEILELEGFERDEATGGIRVPKVSLWAAFESLRGRWLSPDPLVSLVEAGRTEGPALSPESMAAEARLSRPPADWKEVRTELMSRLTPASTYRARWIVKRGTGHESR